jgi:hypothetical protein
MRAGTGLVAVAVALALSACGVGAQGGPEPVGVPTSSVTSPDAAVSTGSPRVAVYLVRGSRLARAERPTPRPAVDAALDALVAGPSRAEVVGGLRTALSPQLLRSDASAPAEPVVTVTVAREFTEVSGGNQLLAVAQVVWTLTELPGVQGVRITTDGRPVEVPTDRGLTSAPVGREDFASVAPGDDDPDGPAPSVGPGTPTPSD